MILELDIGNTRIKWRQLDERHNDCLAQGHVSDLQELQKLEALQKQPVMARMCSVRDESLNEQLRQWVRSSYGIKLQQARVTRSCGGVSNSYEDVSRLGIDRWLAMLAAYARIAGPCVIVDSGTALTVDILNAEGEHEGGYIVPGLQLMRSSLTENTGIRLAETSRPVSVDPGHSTDEAVLNGTLAALLALIEKATSSSKLLLTGGDAEVLAEMLADQNWQVIPSLVMDGLAIACPV